MYFTCLDVLSNHTESDQYSVISHFTVEVDTRFGPYSLCNGYPGQCWGTSNYAVCVAILSGYFYTTRFGCAGVRHCVHGRLNYVVWGIVYQSLWARGLEG